MILLLMNMILGTQIVIMMNFHLVTWQRLQTVGKLTILNSKAVMVHWSIEILGTNFLTRIKNIGR